MTSDVIVWLVRSLASASIALAAAALAMRAAARVVRGRPALHELLLRLRPPGELLVVLIALRVNLEAAPRAHEAWTASAQGVTVAAIFAAVWGATRAVEVLESAAVGRFDISISNNLRARSIRTQIQVLTRVLSIVIVAIGVVAALLTFPWGRQLGTSILAAGGIIGVVAGVAGRSTLGNVVAGLQIALAEPIRIEDVVVVEGEWGNIEQITLTYVVVRVWDQRRLVLPTSYFVEHPFQNWTRSRADIKGTVELWVDHSAPVDRLRDELDRLVSGSANWDRRTALLQVTDASEYSMKVRAVVSAADASRSWDLRCEVREGLAAWLAREHPDALPKLRADPGSMRPT
ncbi:MAG: mechanosensitive ion channel family protein [Acidimicrobiia bacterium]